MCTFLMLHHYHPRYPWIVAANRDERWNRPSTSPRVLARKPVVIGGQDLVAGGTWLGLNSRGLLVAVTNRRTSLPPDPLKESRGCLVLEALRYTQAEECLRWVEKVATRYNYFNLVLADWKGCWVYSYTPEGEEMLEIPRGVVALTNGKPNDWSEKNLARGKRELEALRGASAGEVYQALVQLCRDHQEGEGGTPFCVHQEGFGTVSSTLLILGADLRGKYFFAPGPPCQTPYEDYSSLLEELHRDTSSL